MAGNSKASNMKWCSTPDMMESIIDSLKEYKSVICELNVINDNASKIKFYEQNVPVSLKLLADSLFLPVLPVFLNQL